MKNLLVSIKTLQKHGFSCEELRLVFLNMGAVYKIRKQTNRGWEVIEYSKTCGVVDLRLSDAFRLETE